MESLSRMSTQTMLHAFLVVRFASVLWNPIDDCDESFNFLEPLHYLMHGNGFQTWEYSPHYALRSYAYLLPFKWMMYPFKLAPKFIQYRLFKAALAIICSVCEMAFTMSVRDKFGADVAGLLICLQLGSVAMFRSCTAFVNNSFSMYGIMLAYSFWFRDKLFLSVFAVAVSSILGWVYCAVFGIPIALDIVLFRKRKLLDFIKWSVASTIIICLPMVLVDSYYYGKLTMPTVNHIVYNLFSSAGSHLYGVEPWTYYLKNLLLNFNILTPFILLGLPLAVISSLKSGRWSSTCFIGLVLSPTWIWLLILLAMPHKEDRFLFTAYPLFLLAVSFTAVAIRNDLIGLRSTGASIISRFFTEYLIVFLVFAHTMLSLSRAVALHHGYLAPVDLFSKFSQNETLYGDGGGGRMCIGKNWYRFPSHFLVPSSVQVRFIQSDYRGQLPNLYGRSTRDAGGRFNDLNMEQVDRYVDLESCTYLFDHDALSARASLLEPNYSQDRDRWEVMYSQPLIVPVESHVVCRAFHVPFLCRGRVTTTQMYILKRNY